MLLFLIINVKRLLDILRMRAYNNGEFNILRYGQSGKPDPFNREDTVNNRTAPAAVLTVCPPLKFFREERAFTSVIFKSEDLPPDMTNAI